MRAQHRAIEFRHWIADWCRPTIQRHRIDLPPPPGRQLREQLRSKTMKQVAAFINAAPIETRGTAIVLDPSSGDEIARTADCGPAEIDLAVGAARHASQQLRKVAIAERASI